MISKATIEKYLEHYAEPEAAHALNIKSFQQYNYALTLPVYIEPENCIDTLLENISKEPTKEHTNKTTTELTEKSTKKFLLICVINQPDNLNSEGRTRALKKNKALVQKLHRSYTTQSTYENLILLSNLTKKTNIHTTEESTQKTKKNTEYNHDILIIDRFNYGKEIPIKKGVGLARKIASDIATSLIFKDIIKQPWIFSCDADSKLPKNYFSCLDEIDIRENISVITFNFTHIVDSEHYDQNNTNSITLQTIQEATSIYEACIKYYAKELTRSNSRYAYCSLGSCMAFSFKHYCASRGFPKRPAGEDFYLLNKLAKLGKVIQKNEITINIKTRISSRVPFGTGPAVENIARQLINLEKPTYYNNQAFVCLTFFIQCFIHSSLPSSKKTIDNQSELSKQLSLTTHKKSLTDAIYEAAKSIGINDFFIHTKKQKIPTEKTAQVFEDWFDAFKTLKFIHFLTEHYFPKVSVYELGILEESI